MENKRGSTDWDWMEAGGNSTEQKKSDTFKEDGDLQKAIKNSSSMRDNLHTYREKSCEIDQTLPNSGKLESELKKRGLSVMDKIKNNL